MQFGDLVEMDQSTSTGVRRHRSSPEERRRVLLDFARSGLSKTKYAQRTGLSAWTLTRWQAETEQRGRDATTPSTHRVQLQVFDANAATSSAFVLTIDAKLSLRIPARFEESDLRRLIQVLRESC